MSTTAVKRVSAFCKRYGPGRLPGASRPTVGAGYAAATAALAVAVAFVVLASALTLLFGMVFVGPTELVISLAYVGLLAIPLVVPVAFFCGAVAWQLLPKSMSYRGFLVGMLATVLTYVGTTLLVVPLLMATTSQLGASVAFGLIVGINGFLSTFWLAFPIGAVSGWIHEQAVIEY